MVVGPVQLAVGPVRPVQLVGLGRLVRLVRPSVGSFGRVVLERFQYI